MHRDWMGETRGRHERRRDVHRDRVNPREDFGQADFSNDYAYDPDHRTAYRAADETARRADDYGQADYREDYAYDPDRGPYRRYSDQDPQHRVEAWQDQRDDAPRGRSWRDRAGAFFSGRDEAPRRRRGPSDRVLWAVIVERLEDERGLDLRDVEVSVEDGEVTLNGTVRRRADKRRIEDIAEVDGVRNVQNNLRARGGGWF
jgi:hypothetical protein